MGGIGIEAIFIFYFHILFSIDLGTCQDDPCRPSRCSPYGPEIRFPFRLKDHQPQRCGFPDFDLSCTLGATILHLPPSTEVTVSEIDYKAQTLSIEWSPSCYGYGDFLNHNISVSPYQFQSKEVYNCTIFHCSLGALSEETESCSERGSQFDYISIPSLSTYEYQVLIVNPNLTLLWLPQACWFNKTVLFPIPDTPYLLTWKEPACSNCEAGGGKCGLKNDTTGETTCLHRKGSSWKIAIIVVIAGLLALAVASITSIKVYWRWKTDRKELENQLKVEKFLENYKSLKPSRYSYADLRRITGQFKEKLGQGGFGSVFKGKLPSGLDVAVKLLQDCGGNGEDFINEVATIGNIHHVNVVRLLGFCVDRFRRALIYEFMPNESLEKFIFSRDPRDMFLTWEKLQDITVGIARGIEYLHQGCEQRILHFDIKPHNILLDRKFNPKISDFGLAKLYSKGQSIVSMTATRGTMGYIAPEVFSRNFGNVSYKSDVYSFGMLLLEMVGGRKNIDATVEDAIQVYFPEWIYEHLCQSEELELRIEKRNGNPEIAKKLTIVALWCIQWSPGDRPSMKSVIHMLEQTANSLVVPPNPFTSTAESKTSKSLGKETFNTKLPTISEVE